MKVLVAVLLYPPPRVAERRSIESIEKLVWNDTMDIVYFAGDNPLEHPLDNIVYKHNQARELVLKEGYDAVLFVEADIIVPANALQMLARVPADVAYGLYASRHHGMLLCFPTIDKFSGASISASPNHFRSRWGQILPSEGVGFGCTLVHRRVLEKIHFRRDEEYGRKRGFADDWFFAMDVKANGFKSAHHLGVECGHIGQDGSVRWPDVHAPQLYRIDGGSKMNETQPEATPFYNGEYIVTRQIWHPGENRYYKRGERITLTADKASILYRKKAIELIQSEQTKGE